MMDSIAKLRDFAVANLCGKPGLALLDIADEIEREIEANYLEAPIDYDGLPIKPGHQVELDGKGGEVLLIGCRDVMCNDGVSYTASALTHAKPDPLFDTLALLENGEISIDEATKRIRETLEVDE